MPSKQEISDNRIHRVRAILLTADGKVLFIKRVKPNKPPYWVAPGGGMEDKDDSLLATLHRELYEELGATVEVLREAFVLEHHKKGKDLREVFYICRLVTLDLHLRNGPEFDDPSRGEFIPDAVEINATELNRIEIRTTELLDWLLANGQSLRDMAG